LDYFASSQSSRKVNIVVQGESDTLYTDPTLHRHSVVSLRTEQFQSGRLSDCGLVKIFRVGDLYET
jgi:hypothetical protein